MGGGWFVAFVVAIRLPVDFLYGHLEGFGGEGVGAYLFQVFQIIHETGDGCFFSSYCRLGITLLGQGLEIGDGLGEVGLLNVVQIVADVPLIGLGGVFVE